MIYTFGSAAMNAIEDMLEGIDAPVAVMGSVRLARKLGDSRAVLAIGLTEREQRKLPDSVTPTDALPDRIKAVIAVDVDTSTGELTHHVEDGGCLILASRGAPEEASRDALCGGLMQIEQVRAGRWVITRGQIVELP